MSDKRKPALEKIGCYFKQGNGSSGFAFFKTSKLSNNDVFVYNKGVLWRLKNKPEEKNNEIT